MSPTAQVFSCGGTWIVLSLLVVWGFHRIREQDRKKGRR